MAAISVLAIVAGFQWLQAEHHSVRAQPKRLNLKQQVTAKLQEQLRQASWASFNQAERQFQLGEWREGIALLARAIKFDPENQVASERFFHELIVHREKALPPFIATFDHQDVSTTRPLVRTVLGSLRQAGTRPPSSGMRPRASSSSPSLIRVSSGARRLVRTVLGS